jgi:hypothetical protein
MSGDAGSGLPMQQRWIALFAESSGAHFETQAAAAVALTGSVFLRPIEGRREVWTALQAAAQIYDHLEFTRATTDGRRSYLEWEAAALGLSMAGVTVLNVDDDNLIDLVAIHHRPLAAALAFSVEMRHRMIAQIDPTFFYRSQGEGL